MDQARAALGLALALTVLPTSGIDHGLDASGRRPSLGAKLGKRTCSGRYLFRPAHQVWCSQRQRSAHGGLRLKVTDQVTLSAC